MLALMTLLSVIPPMIVKITVITILVGIIRIHIRTIIPVNNYYQADNKNNNSEKTTEENKNKIKINRQNTQITRTNNMQYRDNPISTQKS